MTQNGPDRTVVSAGSPGGAARLILGNYPCKVDGSARTKLPAKIRDYIFETGEKRVYITTLDGRHLVLIPLSVAAEMVERWQEMPPEEFDVFWQLFSDGQEAAVDDQGRMSFPQEVRKRIEVANSDVRLRWVPPGYIEVVKDEEYKEQVDVPAERMQEAVRTARAMLLRRR
jgi:DNA-binding transcriptional regulator/RsmH inhibitor MraZ